MHQHQGALEALVGQVDEELSQLDVGEHPLVHDRPGRERWEVDVGNCGGGTFDARPELVFDPLANHIGQPVQIDPGGSPIGAETAGEEHLAEGGFRCPRRVTDRRIVDREVPPAEDLHALLKGDLVDNRSGPISHLGLAGQEGDSRGVGTCLRQLECQDLPVEGVGDLEQKSRSVAGVLLGSEGAPVLHTAEGSEPQLDYPVAGLALQVADEVHATGVVFETRLVQALGRGHVGGGAHGTCSAGRPWVLLGFG